MMETGTRNAAAVQTRRATAAPSGANLFSTWPDGHSSKAVLPNETGAHLRKLCPREGGLGMHGPRLHPLRGQRAHFDRGRREFGGARFTRRARGPPRGTLDQSKHTRTHTQPRIQQCAPAMPAGIRLPGRRRRRRRPAPPVLQATPPHEGIRVADCRATAAAAPTSACGVDRVRGVCRVAYPTGG